MKTCSRCKKEKSELEYYKQKKSKTGLAGYCKICSAEVYQENRQLFLKRQKDRRDRRRLTCLEHYGNKCDCCGETKYEFLSIDHINGNGSKHRKSIGRASMYHWLIKNNFPSGFRLLCHNCNQAMGIYGYCPHQKTKGVK